MARFNNKTYGSKVPVDDKNTVPYLDFSTRVAWRGNTLVTTSKKQTENGNKVLKIYKINERNNIPGSSQY